jgi:hypothetical protein
MAETPVAPKTLSLPKNLCEQIDKYLNTRWSSGPSSNIGALNAAAYIGERIIALYNDEHVTAAAVDDAYEDDVCT